MLALTLRHDVRNVHVVAVDRPDNGRRILRLLVRIRLEGDLRSLHCELALVRLVEHRAGTNWRTRLHMLAIVLERGDESSIRPQTDAGPEELEPVLPTVLRRNPLDPRQRMRVEKRSDVKTRGRRRKRVDSSGDQKDCRSKELELHEDK